MLTGTSLLQGLVVALFLHSMPMIASGLHVPSLRLRNQLLGTTAPFAKLRSFQVYNGKISSKESITASETSVALQCRSGGSFSTEGDAISNCLKVVIAGAPAAGKGTQCENIKDKYGVVHLSTGDILRAAVKEGTPLGAKAKEYMDAGKLVPDELIIDVVCERLRQQDCSTQGWLLDGFPRTEAQAQALSAAGMVPDCFILLDVPEEVLVERVTGRRTDPETGKIYHMKFSPPESEEVTARLVQRSDDTEEKIKVRYRDFRANIDEIKASYEDKLVWVDGSLKKDEVTSMIFQALKFVKLEKQEDGNPSQTTAEKWSPGLLVSPPAQEAQASSPPTPTALGMTRMASAQGALRRMLNRLPSSPAATARTAPSRWGNRQARLSI